MSDTTLTAEEARSLRNAIQQYDDRTGAAYIDEPPPVGLDLDPLGDGTRDVTLSDAESGPIADCLDTILGCEYDPDEPDDLDIDWDAVFSAGERLGLDMGSHPYAPGDPTPTRLREPEARAFAVACKHWHPGRIDGLSSFLAGHSVGLKPEESLRMGRMAQEMVVRANRGEGFPGLDRARLVGARDRLLRRVR